MSGAKITTRKKRAWAAIPDDILADCRMSHAARLITGYCVSRPDGWEIRVAAMLRLLGVGDKLWRTAKKQMTACGYLIEQVRRRDRASGRWAWDLVVTDTPSATTPSLGTDGSTTPSLGTGGSSTRGARNFGASQAAWNHARKICWLENPIHLYNRPVADSQPPAAEAPI